VAAVTADAPVSGPLGTDEGGVVVGVGNPTMGDDGLARAVVDEFAGPGATFAGTTAFMALEAMSGADRAVVVDAVDAEGPPGTVHRYPLGPDATVAPEVTMHDVTVVDALDAAGEVYDLPDRLVLVGVVPGAVAEGIGLTRRVERAVPVAAALARAELDGDTMDGHWYCHDCETDIEASSVDDHESRGHRVTGRLRPERLLAQDPWETGDGGER
jgi:hydrogenase maturation protease